MLVFGTTLQISAAIRDLSSGHVGAIKGANKRGIHIPFLIPYSIESQLKLRFVSFPTIYEIMLAILFMLTVSPDACRLSALNQSRWGLDPALRRVPCCRKNFERTGRASRSARHTFLRGDNLRDIFELGQSKGCGDGV